MGVIRIANGGHAHRQVNFTESCNNCSPSDLEFGEIEGRNTDIGSEGYLSNHIVGNEYSGAERAEDCDGSETFAKTNLGRKSKGEWTGDAAI